VDALLAGSARDLRITLTGEWPEPRTGRHAPLDDPAFDARILLETFKGEARVRFAAQAQPDPRVPYRIDVPADARPGPDAVAALVAYANEHRLGLVEIALPQGIVRLERTAAAARAQHLGVSIDEVWGAERIEKGPLVSTFSTGAFSTGAASPSGPASAAGDAGAGRERGLGGSLRRVVRRGLGR
jgi:hypothetical protein